MPPRLRRRQKPIWHRPHRKLPRRTGRCCRAHPPGTLAPDEYLAGRYCHAGRHAQGNSDAAKCANPNLKLLDSDLRHLLASWFNRGFLELRRIDWNTPAAVLDKLIAYEAVHEIQGWEDLRRRMAADRRYFGFSTPLPGDR